MGPRRRDAPRAHDAYHRGAAKMDRVLLRFFGGLPATMYEEGEIDIGYIGSGEDLDAMLAGEHPLSPVLRSANELSIFYLGFDSSRPPFDDPKVRRAFLLATDRQRLLDTLISGSGVLAHGFIPPGIQGYDPDAPTIVYDPEEAHRLLIETSYGSASDLPVIVYTSGPFGPDTRNLLLTIWQENLGADVRLQPLPDYYNFVRQFTGNLFDYGWIADYPHAHNFLDVLFHSSSSDNVGGYANATTDAQLERARTEQDEARQIELYRQINQQLIDDAAAIPLYYGRANALVRPNVSGLTLTPQGIIEFRLLSLEPTA